MTPRTVIVGVMVAGILWASALDAQELRYWGKQPGQSKGWIDLDGGRYYEVAAGDEIPGWGQVREVGDAHLIVERVLTEADKERLSLQGGMVYDVLELQLIREDLRFPTSGR